MRETAGQASVELIALLPLLCCIVALVWQFALVGSAAWSAAQAARAGARAAAVGGDPAAAAPRRARVRVERDGVVAVRVPVPRVIGAVDLGHITMRAAFAEQEGR